jgi:hypothetical protein
MKSKKKKNSPGISALNHRNDQTVNSGNTDEKKIYISFIRLQQHLAMKTYYLKEYVLIPVMENFLNSRSKNELIRIYRAYCYFFNQELSVREFSAFLSHVIIDGFLRARIFYSTTNSKPVKPFSRTCVVEFAKFNRMSARRLAIFNYLSPEPGDDQLPYSIQCYLDDICELLANFDFKQMNFAGKNPMLIDGEFLQWEGYFFMPYYEREEYKVVLELLQKAGIFSFSSLHSSFSDDLNPNKEKR